MCRTKTLDEYMAMPYHMEIVEDDVEGGYAAYFPDLPGCITCIDIIDTMEELMINAEDAKRVWLEATLDDGLEISEPTPYPFKQAAL